MKTFSTSIRLTLASASLVFVALTSGLASADNGPAITTIAESFGEGELPSYPNELRGTLADGTPCVMTVELQSGVHASIGIFWNENGRQNALYTVYDSGHVDKVVAYVNRFNELVATQGDSFLKPSYELHVKRELPGKRLSSFTVRHDYRIKTREQTCTLDAVQSRVSANPGDSMGMGIGMIRN